jgi:hypothetical protein
LDLREVTTEDVVLEVDFGFFDEGDDDERADRAGFIARRASFAFAEHLPEHAALVEDGGVRRRRQF